MTHAVTVSEATAFFIISTIYHTSLLFYLFTFPRFPLNGYHRVQLAAASAYRALLFIAFLPIVFLPMIAVALAVWAVVPTALDAVCHTPTRTHTSRSDFNHPSFLAHSDLVLIVLFFRAVLRYSCNIGSTVLPFSRDRDITHPLYLFAADAAFFFLVHITDCYLFSIYLLSRLHNGFRLHRLTCPSSRLCNPSHEPSYRRYT